MANVEMGNPTAEEQLQNILAASQLVEKRKARVKTIAEELKDAKAYLASAITRQENLCHEALDGPGGLFGGEEAEAEKTETEAAADEIDDDAWRNIELANLTDSDIKPGIIKSLAENDPPIITMGDLSDCQKKDGDFWAKNIKGIGKAALDNIAAATETYWVQYAADAVRRKWETKKPRITLAEALEGWKAAAGLSSGNIVDVAIDLRTACVVAKLAEANATKETPTIPAGIIFEFPAGGDKDYKKLSGEYVVTSVLCQGDAGDPADRCMFEAWRLIPCEEWDESVSGPTRTHGPNPVKYKSYLGRVVQLEGFDGDNGDNPDDGLRVLGGPVLFVREGEEQEPGAGNREPGENEQQEPDIGGEDSLLP